MLRGGFQIFGLLACAFTSACQQELNVAHRNPDGGGLGDPNNPDANHQTNTGCTLSGGQTTLVPTPAEREFRRVSALAFDATGRLYVANVADAPFSSYVLVLDRAPIHGFVRTIGEGIIERARDVAVDALGEIYVLDYKGDGSFDPARVHRFAAGGAHLSTWTPNDMGDDEGWAMIFDGDSRINIGGVVVFRYARTGEPLDAIGLWGGTPGRVGVASGLAWDPRGYVWVADLGRNMIHQYDAASGSHVFEMGGRGDAPGLFDGDESPDVHWGPTRVAVDDEGNIYANDPFVSRIQKFSRQGEFLGELGFGGSREIGPIAIEPTSGNVYVGRGTAIAIACPLGS